MAYWLSQRLLGSESEPPKVYCKASYRIYAITRKSRFPEVFEKVEIDPVTIDVKYVPTEVVYGDRVVIDENFKYIGRKAAAELSPQLICALHVDHKPIPMNQQRPKNRPHFSIEKYRTKISVRPNLRA